ncbi:hypothetical protein NA57DRAFT_33160 [Rhizodiscina lignyota]|uniref:Sensitive to high expression protein 9, mitochondrial n=1 Tax=Rhizodiscina lignyota TaxID=1504668 RepID=A0A9P4IP54_9PEZI|nr:hypothetical protein NA57DRAFT_33160 [Rhizodiscina lignyota]
MRPLFRPASRLVLLEYAVESLGRIQPRATSIRSSLNPVCAQRQFSALATQGTRHVGRTTRISIIGTPARSSRWFSQSARARKEEQTADEIPITRPTGTLPTSTIPKPLPTAPEAVKIAPAEDLPSHNERQRYAFTRRFNTFMDTLLARLATAGHEINKYTGTDYSGIEALRQEIKDQEQLVKARHASVAAAKAAFDVAQTQQLASQKEVVSLLERKNSWSGTDLERYMSLIRMEHVNEQNVQASREEWLTSERALEEARARLERRERAQYHEEQIWSDTIRRNSTWVTIGLMGFNIFLLLANIGVFEPWRRRRMVREIKAALDEKAQAGVIQTAAIEEAIDEAVLPEGATPEEVEKAEEEDVLAIATSADDFVGAVAAEAFSAVGDQSKPTALPQERAQRLMQSWQTALQDLFSQRLVSVRKVDMTTLALESVAIGATVVGVLVMLLRPR